MDAVQWALWLALPVLLALGTAIIVWGFFWDRARGRRRCPRCWYDMAGVPGRLCPECGREARRERHLFRTRRRITLGALLLSLSWVTATGYDAWENGWARAVPTTAMLLIFPLLEAPTAAEETTLNSARATLKPISITAQGLPLQIQVNPIGPPGAAFPAPATPPPTPRSG